METFLGLLSFVAPGVVGICLGYIFPRTRLLKLVAPALLLGLALWIVVGLVGDGPPETDFDTTGRVLMSGLIVIFMVALWTGGAILGQTLRPQARRKRSVG
jgi:hypothetical protein